MIRTSLLAGLAFCVAAPALAALPPAHQRAAELKAILDHQGVVRAFPAGRLIERIEYIRPDLYRVTAGNCVLQVAIVGRPLPDGRVGARRFDVVPGEVECSAG